jgi:hypothetical protein
LIRSDLNTESSGYEDVHGRFGFIYFLIYYSLIKILSVYTCIILYDLNCRPVF